ncbi:MAG: hypothetical protein F6K19_04555 [Cyanothece sp. SIO1E1]|nr:hypothetical protein [Cyanothece sp. SIO1E1]
MSAILPLAQPKAWAKALNQPATEFTLTALTVIAGQIPEGLRGSLYYNGPARLERNGVKVGHWFDGDGAVLAVHFAETGAQGAYRYVRSAGYQDEEATGQFLYGGYGMTAPGPIWARWNKQLKNAANTSVLALPDQLLALWEGGNPHALDLQTLDTIGLETLGALSANCTYSAHPKCDPKTGEIFNFGVVPGGNATLNLYRSNTTGRIIKQNSIPLNGIPLIHDFTLAGKYLVFCVPPVRLNALPTVFGFYSFSDALMWQPKQGSQILVIDRDTLEVVSWGEADPWYQWHFGNSYVDFDGAVVLDLVRYEDFQTNQRLKEVATGQIHTVAEGKLWQIHLRPQTGKITHTETLIDRSCEFPMVPAHQVGQDVASTYLSIHPKAGNSTQELLGAIARYDPQTRTLTEADLGANRYPNEPIYARDAITPDNGWILTLIYDGNLDQSEVWIYNSARLNDEPVCRLALPGVVPPGFHGTWKATSH